MLNCNSIFAYSRFYLPLTFWVDIGMKTKRSRVIGGQRWSYESVSFLRPGQRFICSPDSIVRTGQRRTKSQKHWLFDMSVSVLRIAQTTQGYAGDCQYVTSYQETRAYPASKEVFPDISDCFEHSLTYLVTSMTFSFTIRNFKENRDLPSFVQVQRSSLNPCVCFVSNYPVSSPSLSDDSYADPGSWLSMLSTLYSWPCQN